jgi:hypothetical protein
LRLHYERRLLAEWLPEAAINPEPDLYFPRHGKSSSLPETFEYPNETDGD